MISYLNLDTVFLKEKQSFTANKKDDYRYNKSDNF